MAKESQGIICYVATSTTPSTDEKIGEVKSFNGPSQSVNIIDVTHLESTAKEKMVGLYDGGQFTFGVNMIVTDSGQTKVRECLAARTKSSLLIQLSTAATTQKVTCEGYFTGLSMTGGVDNVLNGDITFEISGGVSWST